MYKLLFRTISVYLVLLLVPLLVFGMVVHRGVSRSLRAQTLRQQELYLRGLVYDLDQTLQSTRDVAEALSGDGRFAALGDEALGRELEEIRGRLGGVSRMVYFSRSQGQLYDNGWHPLESASTPGHEYLNDLGDPNGTPYSLAGGVIVVYPLDFRGGISDRSVGFVVANRVIFYPSEGAGDVLLSIYAPDNTVLAANHSGSVLRYSSSHGQEVLYNEESYLCHSGVSQQSGWRYVALFPLDSQPLLDQVWISLGIASCLILLICGGTVILGFRLTYHPVRDMLLFIERKAQANLHRASFPQIMQALQGIVSSRNTLSAKATLQQRLILDGFLRQLLRGEMTAVKLQEVLEDLGITLDKPCFHLYRITLSTAERVHETPYPLIDEINAYQENIFAVLDDDGCLILLYNFYSDFKMSTLPMLDLLYSFAYPGREVEWDIRESALYTDVLHTGSKYLELCLEDRHPQKSVMGHISCIQYDQEDLARLQAALLARDFGGGFAVVDEVVEALGDSQPGSKSVKFFLYEALKIITEAFHLLKIPPERLPVQDADILFSLDAGETAVSVAYLKSWLEAAGRDHKPQGEQLLDRIETIVAREFSSSQFSVHTIAAETGYSYNYISRYYKDKTGQNLSDSISRRRVELFKELLLGGDDTVQSLIRQVGYDNDASFIRKFKKFEGITPAQYRKLHAPAGR